MLAPLQPLNIISLNIERDIHFDRIIPFLKEQQPDVVLLQEVLDKDLTYLEEQLDMKGVFTVMCRWSDEKSDTQLGLATFSRSPIAKHYSHYYKGDKNDPLWLEAKGPENIPRAILVTEIEKDNQRYCFINTHFTWTPNGHPSDQQHKDLQALLLILDEHKDFILCGDFNAPRGRGIFEIIAAKYKDNIPLHITTTIDKKWHKAGDLNLVVDAIFSTPHYQVQDLQIIDNLSDHCAVLAKIQKISL